MRRTNKIILMTLMISLLLLGIGYAAIQNITLSISGFAEVGAKADNFNVRFLETVDITKNGFDNVIVDAKKTSDVTATINLSGLSKAGETITALYTVKNASPDLSADLTVSTTNDAPEYLTISSQLDKTSIVAGEETTVEVIVEVTKTPISENIRAQIGVELIAMPVQPGEEGTSEGIKDFDQTPESDGRNEYGYYYDRFYCNEEIGFGMVSHSDFSLEYFQLVTTEENQNLPKDEWLCVDYLEPGVADPEILFGMGAKIENEGKTFIDSEGYEFYLSDIIPHGIYFKNRYILLNKEESSKVEGFSFSEDGVYYSMKYDTDGSIISGADVQYFLIPKANGYIFSTFEQIMGTLNITGDLFVTENAVLKLDGVHNYNYEVIQKATCTEEGKFKYKCLDCSKYYIGIITALNHKNDYDLNGVCDDCGEIINYNSASYNFKEWDLIEGDKRDKNPKEIIIPKFCYLDLFKMWCRVETIDDDAFKDLTDLRTVVIPDSIIKIEANAFAPCNSLEIINYTGTQEQWEAIEILEGNDRLNEVTINFNYVIPTE